MIVSRQTYIEMRKRMKLDPEMRKYEFPAQLRVFTIRIPFIAAAIYLDVQVWRDGEAKKRWQQRTE